MTSDDIYIERQQSILDGLEMDVRILARELYRTHDMDVVRSAIERMQIALTDLGNTLPEPQGAGGSGTVYYPLVAANLAVRLGEYSVVPHRVHGARARYIPNLSPNSINVMPVSDHRTVIVEAWAVSVSADAALQVENLLAALPGATAHGSHANTGPARLRRPYAWVHLPGDGTVCTHRSERWTHGHRR